MGVCLRVEIIGYMLRKLILGNNCVHALEINLGILGAANIRIFSGEMGNIYLLNRIVLICMCISWRVGCLSIVLSITG